MLYHIYATTKIVVVVKYPLSAVQERAQLILLLTNLYETPCNLKQNYNSSTCRHDSERCDLSGVIYAKYTLLIF